MRIRLVLVALAGLSAACTRNGSARPPDAGETPIAAEPVSVAPPPSASPAPPASAAPTPPAASASAVPPAAPAGACRTRTSRAERDIVGSARTLSGAMAPTLDLVPGEDLCVETRRKHWQLVGFKLVPTPAHPARTLSVTLSTGGAKGATLRIDNPTNMMLRYTVEVLRPGKKKHEHVVACPVEPGKSKETRIKGPVGHVVVSNLHLKGPGTAGSMLCM